MDEIDKIKFKINHMQLDNYIKGTQFPVIISPVQKSNSFDIPLMSLQVVYFEFYFVYFIHFVYWTFYATEVQV